MKRTLIFSITALLLCITRMYAADIMLNGIAYNIDTLKKFPAGPGTTWLSLHFTRVGSNSSPLDVHILQVDTRNPYVSIEEELGKDKLVGTERPSAMAERITTPMHIAFAGTNGDFFVTSGDVGRPTGLTIEDNEYAYIGSTSRRVGAVKANGKPVVATDWSYKGYVYTAGGDTLKIKHVNYTRNADELVLYNRHQGTTTGTNQYGTELLVELCNGEQWKTNGRQRGGVRAKERNTGNMTIPAGQAVLSGHGIMQHALDSLTAAGDTLTIRYVLKLDGVNTNLSQAIGGDNYALIVDSGRAETSNFWNELHPRTGYGSSVTGDSAIFCIVDGRGLSVGCTTKVLGEIMRHYGAWRAVNWDGGGSSSMYIRHVGNQVNKGSDGAERAVGNAMFVVANIPEADDTITTLVPHYPVYDIPYYGQYTPHFYGYNKYGVLLSADVEGVTLSCDSSTGAVINSGTIFYATTRTGGTLTATAGRATATIVVNITEGEMRLTHDSVIIDSRNSWQAGVESVNIDGKGTVAAQAFTWTSLDSTICTVSDAGVVSAVSNGDTYITAAMDNFADTMSVRVQTPATTPLTADDISDTESWQLSATAGFNPYWSTTDDGTPTVRFNYSVTRKPYILFTKGITLFGLPDTVKITYSTDAVLDEVSVMLKDATRTNFSHSPAGVVSPAGKASLVIPLSNVLADQSDKTHYPVSISQIRFYINSATEKGERYLTLHDISLCYKGIEVLSSLPELQAGSLCVYPNPAGDRITVEGAKAGSTLRFYDVNGRCVLSTTLQTDNTCPVNTLTKGTWIMTTDDGQSVIITKK